MPKPERKPDEVQSVTAASGYGQHYVMTFERFGDEWFILDSRLEASHPGIGTCPPQFRHDPVRPYLYGNTKIWEGFAPYGLAILLQRREDAQAHDTAR